MSKSPLDIIADNMPTYADCYSGLKRIPSYERLAKEAARIISELERAGFEIVRKEEQQ